MKAASAQIQGTRMRQEDALRVEALGDGELLAIVADGLGGHPGGDVASREGVGAFAREFLARRTGAEPAPRDWLKHAILGSHAHLRALQRRDPELDGMATTLVSLYVHRSEFWAASVGDSYLLLHRQGRLMVLNELHSEAGGVTSCLGYNLSRVDLADRLLIEPGDRFLLASDGIATLDSDEIGGLLGAAADAGRATADVLAAIQAAALPNQDNVSVIAIFA